MSTTTYRRKRNSYFSILPTYPPPSSRPPSPSPVPSPFPKHPPQSHDLYEGADSVDYSDNLDSAKMQESPIKPPRSLQKQFIYHPRLPSHSHSTSTSNSVGKFSTKEIRKKSKKALKNLTKKATGKARRFLVKIEIKEWRPTKGAKRPKTPSKSQNVRAGNELWDMVTGVPDSKPRRFSGVGGVLRSNSLSDLGSGVFGGSGEGKGDGKREEGLGGLGGLGKSHKRHSWHGGLFFILGYTNDSSDSSDTEIEDKGKRNDIWDSVISLPTSSPTGKKNKNKNKTGLRSSASVSSISSTRSSFSISMTRSSTTTSRKLNKKDRTNAIPLAAEERGDELWNSVIGLPRSNTSSTIKSQPQSRSQSQAQSHPQTKKKNKHLRAYSTTTSTISTLTTSSSTSTIRIVNNGPGYMNGGFTTSSSTRPSILSSIRFQSKGRSGSGSKKGYERLSPDPTPSPTSRRQEQEERGVSVPSPLPAFNKKSIFGHRRGGTGAENGGKEVKRDRDSGFSSDSPFSSPPSFHSLSSTLSLAILNSTTSQNLNVQAQNSQSMQSLSTDDILRLQSYLRKLERGFRNLEHLAHNLAVNIEMLYVRKESMIRNIGRLSNDAKLLMLDAVFRLRQTVARAFAQKTGYLTRSLTILTALSQVINSCTDKPSSHRSLSSLPHLLRHLLTPPSNTSSSSPINIIHALEILETDVGKQKDLTRKVEGLVKRGIEVNKRWFGRVKGEEGNVERFGGFVGGRIGSIGEVERRLEGLVGGIGEVLAL